MIEIESVINCLKILRIQYTPNASPLIIHQEDNTNQPYKVSASIIDSDTLVLVSHYLPLSVGDAIPMYDRILLNRNRLVMRAMYERDAKANEYRVKGHVDLNNVFSCSILMAALLDILKLMSYRHKDRDDAIDPPP